LKASLATVDERTKKYAHDWRDLQLKMADDPALLGGNAKRVLPLSVKALTAEVASLKSEVERLRAERKSLAAAAADQGPPAGANPIVNAAPANNPQSVGGVQLDLINLANSVASAAGAVQTAKIKLENAEPLFKSGAVTPGELAGAKAELDAALRRRELLRSIAGVALEAAENEMARSKKLADQGLMSMQEFESTVAKVKMLALIVKGAN
jgi:uncharacterized small protein (DUF1192 family)